MSKVFTKLFSSITSSTIWQEPLHTKVLWITILAMSDANGFVAGSVPGLAHIAGVTMDQALESLNTLKSPDQWSRTKIKDGRRIEEVDGGWIIINYLKHREERDGEDRREYMREYMAKKRHVSRNVNFVSQCKPKLAHAEAEAEADIREEKEKEKENQLTSLVQPNSSDAW